MARSVHNGRLDLTDGKRFTIDKEVVELAAVSHKGRLQIEYRRKVLLYFQNTFSNGNPATELLLEIRGRRQMIGMRVGF